jgi:hypothetical protein
VKKVESEECDFEEIERERERERERMRIKAFDY